MSIKKTHPELKHSALAVPGMVPGSPGMEAPNPSNYKVLSISDTGEIATYATRRGRSNLEPGS